MPALFIRLVLTNGTVNKYCLSNFSLYVQLETQMQYRGVKVLKC
jgi:hypothetical protein